MIEFGRFDAEGRERRGLRKPETFDFLGFTHHCVKTKTGGFRVGRKTTKEKLNAKIKRIKDQLRKRVHRILERHLPRPTVLHPWPSQRFYAKYPR